MKVASVFLVLLLICSSAACSKKTTDKPQNNKEPSVSNPSAEDEPDEPDSGNNITLQKPSGNTGTEASKIEPEVTPAPEPEPTPEPDTEPEPSGINKLRPDYDLGTCRSLKGNVTAIIFYLDDFESSWKESERNHFTEKEIKPGLEFLEKSAKKYNIELNIDIAEVHSSIYYDNKVEININQSGYATIDTLRVAAQALGYKDDLDLVAKYEEKYGTEILCFTVFNKEGTAYALNPKRGSGTKIAEHNLIFAYDLNSTGNEPVGGQSSVIAHETLHLYGAEDYYSPAERKPIAKKYYPNDIMLSCKYYLFLNSFGDATAFYIGWTDVAPPMLYEENW